MKNYKSLIFNKDIESLRGLAIFFVLIYHFYPNILPKGYLGVDLFFVISGYLITSLLLKNKKVSFLYFINRRLLRLLPPIFAVLILCILLTSIIFLKHDLESFWKSLLTTIFIIPNFYFLITSGYFGEVNELKPLLHMWSIGVEIQFYIFFSIYLILIKKFFKNKFLFFIFLIMIISF